MTGRRTQIAQRLLHMSWDELRFRSAQELSKRWDALVFGRGRRSRRERADARGNFFFSAEELATIVALIRKRLPDTVTAVIEQAERVCRHEFDLLGYEGLRYGTEIDWHLEVVNGKRAPLKPWFKIRFLNYEEVGDVKVTWELNRHQHLVTLSKAYIFTGDERFADQLVLQWNSWGKQNPYPLGVNWASSLEVAFRAIAWLWMLRLLENCPALSPSFKSNVYEALMLSGHHIERYRSTYFSPNTHLLGEGVALFFLGTLCNGNATGRWKRLGWEIVLAEAERQVRADGMHFEQSTYYHVYALDMFLHARILASANGIPIPKKLDSTIEKMLEALTSLAVGGVVPRFGDDDGGRLFDPRRNRVEHLLDPLATGAALFGRPEFKAMKPELVEETLWLLGEKGAHNFDEVPVTSAPLKSLALPDSGLYVMAIGTGTGARLVADAGPQGAYGAGHGHADALSLQVAVGGRELLVDSGTFVYISAGQERRQFRGTAFHNTVQLDGTDQAEGDGPFPWRRLPQVRVENCASGESFDLLVASHNGYGTLPDAVTHRRHIFNNQSQFWFVLDELEGRGAHRAESFWHLAPGLQWQLQPGRASAEYDSGGLALIFPELQGWTPKILDRQFSAVYGARVKNEALSFRCEEVLPQRFATIVLPVADAVPMHELGSMRQEYADDQLLVYRYDRGSDSHYLFFSSSPWTWHQLGSDARFLYYALTESGGKRLVMCAGSYLQVERENVVSCSRVVSRLEWSRQKLRDAFSCSDEGAVSSVSWDHMAALEPGMEKVQR